MRGNHTTGNLPVNCITRYLLLLGLLLTVLPAPAYAQHTVWQIDPAGTTVEFYAKLLAVKKVKGSFPAVSGTVTLLHDHLERSSVDVVIDPGSVDTNLKKRDRHLRNRDFFNVERYPAMTFRSTRIEPVSDGGWKVTGDLTIRDKTRPVVLDVENTTPMAELQSADRVRGRATGQINRRDFGLNYSSMAIGDTVDIAIDIELTRHETEEAE
jgi:polyisoprenoid-binding protein YceI